MVHGSLVTLRRKGYQGRRPWLVWWLLASSDRSDSSDWNWPRSIATIETIDGKQIIERLDAIDNSSRFYRYANMAGFSGGKYTPKLQRGRTTVGPKGPSRPLPPLESTPPGIHYCPEEKL